MDLLPRSLKIRLKDLEAKTKADNDALNAAVANALHQCRVKEDGLAEMVPRLSATPAPGERDQKLKDFHLLFVKTGKYNNRRICKKCIILSDLFSGNLCFEYGVSCDTPKSYLFQYNFRYFLWLLFSL